MRILWFTWKDVKNPLSGGAEVVAHEIAQRLVRDGHHVTLLTSGFVDSSGAQAPHTEVVHGYNIIRVGGRYSVYWHAYRYYRTQIAPPFFMRKRKKKERISLHPDVVIEEVNTVPFMTKLYLFTKKENFKQYLFFHQLCREIWFYQMMFPLSLIGYVLEPLYLHMLSTQKVLTVSESTKNDLQRYGFLYTNITILSEGTTIKPLDFDDLASVQKFELPTILSLGAVRAMKRTDHIVKAFNLLKERVPQARLIIAGDTDDSYAKKVIALAVKSPHKESIQIHGRVSQEVKTDLMQRSHIIAVTSIKEGWGLIVTEAGSQGTPAVVYNVDGLRDSVRHDETGLISTQNTPQALAHEMFRALKIQGVYDKVSIPSDNMLANKLGRGAWIWSQRITFDQSYSDFTKAVKIVRATRNSEDKKNI